MSGMRWTLCDCQCLAVILLLTSLSFSTVICDSSNIAVVTDALLVQKGSIEWQREDDDLQNTTARGKGGWPSSQSQNAVQFRKAAILREIREENDWKNDLVLFALPGSFRAMLPRLVQTWLRNYIATLAMYLILGAVWSYYIYVCFGNELFPKGNMPSWTAMGDQIKIAITAAPLYAMLPVIVEALVESGVTRAYSRVADVGLPAYLGYFVLYMSLVEVGVYCMHRGLHDFKPGYRYLHHIHHKYNKENTMSPFAGLAFHPLDGILQAFPYLVMLFIVPMHFLTHELLLFATGIWTNNIHDCLHSGLMPIMGAGYHSIHHTTYRHNYGEYTIYMDWLCGTLVSPEEYAAGFAEPAAAKHAPVKEKDTIFADAGLRGSQTRT